MITKPKDFKKWVPGQSDQEVRQDEHILLLLKNGKLLHVTVRVTGYIDPFNAKSTKQVIAFRNPNPENLVSVIKVSDILFYKRQANHIKLIDESV